MVVSANLPTEFGKAKIYGFEHQQKQHCAVVFGDIQDATDVLCRVHSSCVTGDVFHSLKCDCGEQLKQSLELISKASGILIYLDQEGRDIGLINKIKAYNLQDSGVNTIDANTQLGLSADNRNYKIVGIILKHFGIDSIELITNNPDKVEQIGNQGIRISARIPSIIKSNPANQDYLKIKKEKMGHML